MARPYTLVDPRSTKGARMRQATATERLRERERPRHRKGRGHGDESRPRGPVKSRRGARAKGTDIEDGEPKNNSSNRSKRESNRLHDSMRKGVETWRETKVQDRMTLLRGD